MTSDQVARDYLTRARARWTALAALMSARAYPDVVRESQDLVELVLKGALRFVGVDPPKRHDVHGRVIEFADRLPAEWRSTLQELRGALDQLAQDRSAAFYGDEDADVPASDLFGEGDARRAMSVAERVLDLYARLLGDQPGERRTP
ncbi:MAG TPA: HEPN domain-containing protein [Candidatus Tectomicrobia bacterium]|nr:HEPN domain-containing protein [Candidatus Tectomicrobia bacterium]